MSLILLFFSLAAWGGSDSPSTVLDPMEFQERVRAVGSKVPEFSWLAETAKRHGLKVWLFGGSASSFAHYVKENMLLERGVDEFYAQPFSENAQGERDYLDIFRPTQDIDLVVDGEIKSIDTFEQEVMVKFPEMQGNKSRWEVRPLQEDRGEKLALLNNPNFLTNTRTPIGGVDRIAINCPRSQ